MKTLNFDDVKRYEILYEALLTCSTKGAETRALYKILVKLEKLGAPKDNSSLLYTLVESGNVELEDSEYELVHALINNVQWHGVATKVAGEMLEWYDNVNGDVK